MLSRNIYARSNLSRHLNRKTRLNTSTQNTRAGDGAEKARLVSELGKRLASVNKRVTFAPYDNARTAPIGTLWSFTSPSVNDELGVMVAPSSTIRWGDGDTESLDSNVITTHTYNGDPLIKEFGVKNGEYITKFETETTGGEWPTVKFGGVFDSRAIPHADEILIWGHDITDYISNTNTKSVRILFNKLTGSVVDYLTPTVEVLWLQFNLLTGGIPNLSSYTKLKAIATSSNNNIGGDFPILPTNIEIVDFGANGLTGDLPSLSSYNKLVRCWIYNNGNLNIPINWAAPVSLVNLLIPNCSLTSTEVNTVLVAMESLGTSYGILKLENNSSPTGSGITAKDALISRGWEVLTN